VEGRPERHGWDLVTSRPVTEEGRRRMDGQARAEAEERGGKKPKLERKRGDDGRAG
jgi:hypothetical protein